MEKRISTMDELLALPTVNKTILANLNEIEDEIERKYMIASYLIPKLIQHLNGDWKCDFTDGTWKYYPWFYVEKDSNEPSGFGFSYLDYGHSYAGTVVGSRLCSKNKETAMYAAKTFLPLFRSLMLEV